MGMKDNENQVGTNMSALDNTELVPENMSQIKNPTSPTKFTGRLLNETVLKVEPQETNLLKLKGLMLKKREILSQTSICLLAREAN